MGDPGPLRAGQLAFRLAEQEELFAVGSRGSREAHRNAPGHVVEDAEHTDHGRRVDCRGAGLVVEAYVATGNRSAELLTAVGEAAYGLGVLLSEADAELVTPAIEEMRACVQLENDPEIDGLLLEALGATKFAKEEQRAEAEAFIVTESRTGTAAKTLGAVKGLEVLMRSGPRRQVTSRRPM